MKTNYFKNVFTHDEVIVALHARKEKYLDYEKSITGNVIGNVRMRCHAIEVLNSFGGPGNFYRQNGGYAKVTFTEMIVLKKNASLKILVDDKGQLLATVSGDT